MDRNFLKQQIQNTVLSLKNDLNDLNNIDDALRFYPNYDSSWLDITAFEKLKFLQESIDQLTDLQLQGVLNALSYNRGGQRLGEMERDLKASRSKQTGGQKFGEMEKESREEREEMLRDWLSYKNAQMVKTPKL